MECKRCGRRFDSKLKRCPYCDTPIRKKKVLKDEYAGPADSFEITHRLEGSSDAKIDRIRKEHARKRKKRELARKRRRLVLIMLAIVILVVAYVLGKTSKNAASVSATPTATATSKPSQEPSNKKISSKSNSNTSSSDSKKSSVKDMSDSCTNYINKDKGINIPYPNEMTKDGESNDKTQKSITTKSGDATMVISAERVSQDSDVNTLLNKYESGIGVKALDSSVDTDEEYYTIDFERSGEFKHRFGYIKDGYHVYYDFTYDESSSKISTYKNYISYIDDYIERRIDGTVDDSLDDDDKTSTTKSNDSSDDEDDE